MSVKDLLERRAKLVSELRGITESPTGDGGDLSSEQSEKFDALKGDLQTVEKRIERQRIVDEAERRLSGEPITIATGDHRWNEQRRNYSLVRALAGAAGLPVDDGPERETQQEIRRRTGQKFRGIPIPAEVFEQRVLTSTGDGSDLIATDHLGNQFIDRLREAVVVRRLGARVLRGLTGNVDIGRLDTSGTVAWIAENGAITAADQVFDAVSLTPKHAGAITELSRNMLQQSSPDIEQLVRGDFAKLLASALDTVAISGGGTNEPTGILAASGTGSQDLSGGVTWSNLQSLMGQVEDADSEGTAFLTNPKAVRVLRTTLKVSGSPELGYIADSRTVLDGYPLSKTTNVPVASGTPDTTQLIFGRFTDMLIGFWSEIDVLVNPFESTAYSKGNVQIRAMMTADVALRHAESFAKGTGIDVESA